MRKLSDWKSVFAATGLVGMLLFASPVLSTILRFPSGERFSELWLLGPGHMTEGYPFDVTAGESYLVYVGVGNQMGSSVYYGVQVKLRNDTDDLPNATAAVPSPLPRLYEYRVFVQDGRTWEQPLTFSFSQISVGQNQSVVGSLTVNGATISIDKSAYWNSTSNEYAYELFMELWIYNATVDSFQYHNRFVGIRLNMTATS
jgi:hypothetical protein